MRRFAGIELGTDTVPDETSILRFRHLLEKHRLTEALFTEVGALLEQKKLLIKSGTIVDATIITAPSSTKNQEQQRDPEMKQTRKGTSWYFGMKVHVGTDKRGLVHTLRVTHAAESDVSQFGELLHGDEREIYGDRAYWSEPLRQQARAAGIRYRVNRRGTLERPVGDAGKRINRTRSRVRAHGEFAFNVVKHQWGQGALPGSREEPDARLCRVRTREPVHGEAPTGADPGDVSPLSK